MGDDGFLFEAKGSSYSVGSQDKSCRSSDKRMEEAINDQLLSIKEIWTTRPQPYSFSGNMHSKSRMHTIGAGFEDGIFTVSFLIRQNHLMM